MKCYVYVASPLAYSPPRRSLQQRTRSRQDAKITTKLCGIIVWRAASTFRRRKEAEVLLSSSTDEQNTRGEREKA